MTPTEAADLQEMNNSLGKGGWQVPGQQLIIDAPWVTYHDPKRDRIKSLRASDPDDALLSAITDAEEEIAQCEARSDEVVYGLFVVRPA